MTCLPFVVVATSSGCGSSGCTAGPSCLLPLAACCTPPSQAMIACCCCSFCSCASCIVATAGSRTSSCQPLQQPLSYTDQRQASVREVCDTVKAGVQVQHGMQVRPDVPVAQQLV
eukprot:CAMPEP_0202885098 /NCGR_PEP_ID=MMETSP1391-20130828/41491_1 /ASSEMBLY_ACC=CAM_ASM_000867 /TAXON_ID=1034604 /ORGANISM="Chlamydomonas leiostraca, Strain SAG 11-49" /LENGTH=114 /DNA_ID=CAMNT_0049568339 /DNA_START=356 /DNA_END=700 /DNA_ORIENTATION=+